MDAGQLAIIGVFGSIITFVFLFFKTRNTERMELIKSGNTAEIFNSTRAEHRMQTLKWGIIVLFAGIGVFLGTLVDERYGFNGFGILFCLLIFGGIGMILFYIISGRIEDTD